MNTAAATGKTAASTGSAGFDRFRLLACRSRVGPPQRDGEPHERRRDFPRRTEPGDEISRHLGDAAAPAAVIHRYFANAQACGRDAHLHLQIPAVGLLAHAEAAQLREADRAE